MSGVINLTMSPGLTLAIHPLVCVHIYRRSGHTACSVCPREKLIIYHYCQRESAVHLERTLHSGLSCYDHWEWTGSYFGLLNLLSLFIKFTQFINMNDKFNMPLDLNNNKNGLRGISYTIWNLHILVPSYVTKATRIN